MHIMLSTMSVVGELRAVQETAAERQVVHTPEK